MKQKIKTLLESILKESVEDKPKIKLVPLWQDREGQRLKKIEKILQKEVIEGDLELTGLQYENLGNIKHVKGNLGLFRCRNLTHLPEGLIVEGHLDIRSCTSLKELPKGLKVGGYLILISCKEELSAQAEKMFGKKNLITYNLEI